MLYKELSVKGVFRTILTTEAVVYAVFNLLLRLVIVCLSLKHARLQRDRKETNPLYHLQDIAHCIVNWSTVSEIPLFILSLVYGVSVYPLDLCLCPSRWQLELGAIVILLTWLQLIVLSTQFQFIGVYILMLSRVLVTFLKTSVLLCLLIGGFGLVFYLSLNDPKDVGVSVAVCYNYQHSIMISGLLSRNLESEKSPTLSMCNTVKINGYCTRSLTFTVLCIL